MRPLSFTKNLGGLEKVFDAIRRGYAPGVTVDQFRRRCGLSDGLSLLVSQFFLFAKIESDREFVVNDTLIQQTLARPKFDVTLARLYFFAVNLAMPGERLAEEQREAGQLQRHVLSRHIYGGEAWRLSSIDKDDSLEPFVRSVNSFTSVRKWVNNYWYLMDQCRFVAKPDGTIEPFADAWGLLALNLFFDRYSALHQVHDIEALVRAARVCDVHELLGTPRSWLDARIQGAADMYLSHETPDIPTFRESKEERRAALKGVPSPSPSPGTSAERRESVVQQVIRRGENRAFIQSLYNGVCQVSGVVLRLPNNEFTVDCAHIRPLGRPHNGPDDVANMLSLSPTMHRLFDRGCIRIHPETLSIELLHGNSLPHMPQLMVRDGHRLSREYISYFNEHLLK